MRLQQGMDRVKAAIEAATLPAWPLLGATFVAVLAFYPIAASDEECGRVLRDVVLGGGDRVDHQLGAVGDDHAGDVHR